MYDGSSPDSVRGRRFSQTNVNVLDSNMWMRSPASEQTELNAITKKVQVDPPPHTPRYTVAIPSLHMWGDSTSLIVHTPAITVTSMPHYAAGRHKIGQITAVQRWHERCVIPNQPTIFLTVAQRSSAMKNLFVVPAAVAVLFIVGCSNNSASPVASEPGLTQNASSIAAGIDDGARSGRIEGTVREVDLRAGTVTIGRTVVQTNAATKIERNGIHTVLSAFKVGDFGQARLIGSSNVASKVEARGV